MKYSFHLLLIYLSNVFSILPDFKFKEEYEINDLIPLQIGKINSILTQIPYDYYDKIKICTPKSLNSKNYYLGEFLTGDISHSSNFEIHMLKNKTCERLCENVNFSQKDIENIKQLIDDGYTANIYLDNLPAGVVNITDKLQYNSGVPIGYSLNEKRDKYFLYNHYEFVVLYARNKLTKKIFVNGFYIQTRMFRDIDTCNEFYSKNRTDSGALEINENMNFTYSVTFKHQHMEYNQRWEPYLKSFQSNISYHWLSVVNSSIYIIFFAFVVALIFTRAIKKEITLYNSRTLTDEEDEVLIDSGWKQISNEVFRKPTHSMILCAFVATGFQLFVSLTVSILLGYFNIISQSNRGALMTMIILLYVFTGIISGYISAKLYRIFQGNKWLVNALVTCLLFPSLAFIVFLTNDLFLWVIGSSAAVAFSKIFSLILLWICCSAPLILIGSFIGLKSQATKLPCKVNQVPARIPEQPYFTKNRPLCILGGVLPFFICLFELIYVMSAIWKHHIYSLYGFFFIAMMGTIISSTETSIILCYYKLCRGDYKWWWRSFFISGSPAFYVFAYAIYYFLVELPLTSLYSVLLYFSYMALLSFGVFLILGSIGFGFTFVFIYLIYSMIKIN